MNTRDDEPGHVYRFRLFDLLLDVLMQVRGNLLHRGEERDAICSQIYWTLRDFISILESHEGHFRIEEEYESDVEDWY